MYDFPWYKMLVLDYSNTDPLSYAELYQLSLLSLLQQLGLQKLSGWLYGHCSAVSVTAVLSHIPQWQSGLHLTRSQHFHETL